MKKEFESAEMTVQSFTDIIATSLDYTGGQGEYDIYGDWMPLPEEEP